MLRPIQDAVSPTIFFVLVDTVTSTLPDIEDLSISRVYERVDVEAAQISHPRLPHLSVAAFPRFALNPASSKASSAVLPLASAWATFR